MTMVTYVVKEAFTLSLINNPALSMGIPARPGTKILYDGYNVEYGAIKDASITLQGAIRAGWLVPEEQYSAPEEVNQPVRPAKPVQMPEEIPLKPSSGSVNNNGSLIYMEGTKPLRGATAETLEGAQVRQTNFADAGSHKNVATDTARSGPNPYKERQRMAVVHEESGITEVAYNGSREASASPSSEGSVKIGHRAVTTKQGTVVEAAFMEEEYPMRRMARAKNFDIIGEKTPLSEASAEHMANANLGKKGTTLEARSTVHHDPGMYSEFGVIPGMHVASETPIGQKVHSSGINEREQTPRSNKEEFERLKEEAKARILAKKAEEAQRVHETPEQAAEREIQEEMAKDAKPVEKATKKTVPKKTVKKAVSKGTDKDAKPAAKTTKKTAPKKDRVLSLKVGGVTWKEVSLSEKIVFVKSIQDAKLLEEIRVHKNSHHSVRKAAAETKSALA